jgi:hypothetical protein
VASRGTGRESQSSGLLLYLYLYTLRCRLYTMKQVGKDS